MDRMLEEGTVNEEKKPVPARKLEFTRTGAAVSLENAQGIDFVASQLDKRELIMDREMAFNQVPFFMRMRGENQDLSNKHLAKPSNVPGKYIRPKDYLRLGQTYNSHFQIHNNLKVVSGQDLFFSDKVQGLMHVNMQSASMVPLLSRRSCVAMDMYNYEYLAVVEDPNTCHFVHLETNRVMKSSNFQLGERELVNTVQFLDDRSGSLKVALGANADILQVFDVETEGEAVHSFRVPYNVNYLCFDKEGKTTALGYDGKPVDLFDFRSGKKIGRAS